MSTNRGGKIAKKMARKSELIKPELPERQFDQFWGRVIRNLGNSQVMVYRNDAEEVICSLPGRLKRKRIRITIGDIVLISMREGLSLTNSGKEMGDVLDKVDPTLYGKLKKEGTFNQRLLNNLESLMTSGGGAGAPAEIEEDDFFIRDGEEDEEDEESDSSEASHDSRKKDRRKNAGRARKEAGEFTNAEIDRI